MPSKNESQDPLHRALTEQFIADLQVEYRQDLEWMTRPRPIIPDQLEEPLVQPSIFTKVRHGVARMMQRPKPRSTPAATVPPPTSEGEPIEAEYVVLEASSSQLDEERRPPKQGRIKDERFSEIPINGHRSVRKSSGRDRATNQVRDERNGQSARVRGTGSRKNPERGCANPTEYDD